MERYKRDLFSLGLMVLLFWGLVRLNAASPRQNVAEIAAGTNLGSQLVLLEGGAVEPNAYGGESRRFTLYWEGDGCLLMPKASENVLLVNGVEWDDLRDGKLRLFQFRDAPTADHIYEIEIRSQGKALDRYGSCVYLGTLPAVSACISSQIISRYLVTGICFCVILFAGVLYAWKRSEKYLFWLMLYALWMLLRAQDALGLAVFVSRESAVFQAVDRIVTTSTVFRLLYNLLSAYLNYQVLKRFVPTKLLGHSILLYIAAASLVQAVGNWYMGRSLYWDLFYYGVLYLCQFLCMEQGTELFWFEHQILLLAWGVTVVLQLFYSLNLYGVLPNGAFGLQFHIPPITSCVYVMAFFIVACCHFALKFQEAEYLNVHLEGIVREKTEAQSALIRSMLHNLKTPLFSVVGYADMAASRLENPAQARRCLTKVSEKAQYVSGLLDRLFLLTQMDANQMVFQRVPVRLGELLASVAENARLKGKEKGIAVTLEGVQDALCMGDPLYLQQSFQNIADNAVEYVGQGGVLYITVRQDANGWAVCIADNGCGISTEELPKIFDRYYSNHYGKRNSSGLGLSIAKEIVERHGGRITVQSEPGRGTAFTVWLPDGENADHVASAEKI